MHRLIRWGPVPFSQRETGDKGRERSDVKALARCIEKEPEEAGTSRGDRDPWRVKPKQVDGSAIGQNPEGEMPHAASTTRGYARVKALPAGCRGNPLKINLGRGSGTKQTRKVCGGGNRRECAKH